jgi:hypothetical protein
LGGSRVYDLIEKMIKIKPVLKDFYCQNNITAHDSVKRNLLFPRFENNIGSLFEDKEINPIKNNKYWAIRKLITQGCFPTEITITDFGQKNVVEGIGFTGPDTHLKTLKTYFKKYSSLICFYIASVSNRLWTRGPYIISKSDFSNFPFVDNLNDRITKFENIFINDIVEYILLEYSEGENAVINITNANKKKLIDFSKVYCDSLNVIYQSGGKRYTLTNIFEGNAYFVCEIQYTNKKATDVQIEKTNKTLTDLLESWNFSQSGKINKLLRVYGNEKICIIKPKQLRYWLKSKALRDADETFDDILRI